MLNLPPLPDVAIVNPTLADIRRVVREEIAAAFAGDDDEPSGRGRCAYAAGQDGWCKREATHQNQYGAHYCDDHPNGEDRWVSLPDEEPCSCIPVYSVRSDDAVGLARDPACHVHHEDE